jgi:hypothetical protein
MYYSIPIAYPPVQSVTTVAYTKEDGTGGTLAVNTDYGTSGLMTPLLGAQDIIQGKIWPVNSWPATKYVPEAVVITTVNGFGPDSTYVPANIREAILRYVSFMYEDRKDEISGSGLTLAKFEMSIDRLMSTFENWQHIPVEEC